MAPRILLFTFCLLAAGVLSDDAQVAPPCDPYSEDCVCSPTDQPPSLTVADVCASRSTGYLSTSGQALAGIDICEEAFSGHGCSASSTNSAGVWSVTCSAATDGNASVTCGQIGVALSPPNTTCPPACRGAYVHLSLIHI